MGQQLFNQGSSLLRHSHLTGYRFHRHKLIPLKARPAARAKTQRPSQPVVRPQRVASVSPQPQSPQQLHFPTGRLLNVLCNHRA